MAMASALGVVSSLMRTMATTATRSSTLTKRNAVSCRATSTRSNDNTSSEGKKGNGASAYASTGTRKWIPTINAGPSTRSSDGTTPHLAARPGRPGRPTSTRPGRPRGVGVGVRVFYQSRAVEGKGRHHRQQDRQRRGKRSDPFGEDGGSSHATAGKRSHEKDPRLLTTFPSLSSTSGSSPQSPRDTATGDSSGSSSDVSGVRTVPYRPFIFPGDAYRYPFSSAPIPRGDSESYNNNNNNNNTPLPLLDASPLLDPRSYSRKSAIPGGTVTVSGGDAARRLARGRVRLGDIVRGKFVTRDVGMGRRRPGSKQRRSNAATDRPLDTAAASESSATSSLQVGAELGRSGRRRARPFAVKGTGVPQSLFQDHIDLADDLLRSMDGAAEVSFGNCVDGTLDFDNVLRVRSRAGENNPYPWPPDWSSAFPFIESRPPYLDGCDHRMKLYLTVMDRLARTFGQKILDPKRDATDDLAGIDLSGETGSDNDETCTRGSGNGATSFTFDLRHWNSSFLRGNAFPPNLVSYCAFGPGVGIDSKNGLVSLPIVELSQGSGVACPTHVRISIQGTPPSSPRLGVSASKTVIRRKRVSPLTLIFDAKFSYFDGS
mmetsp:Transcript_6985/g.15404  ORF Transcript_6985/g.15404 Transcript_6985/m.15404 type:complete len:602 (+) Transcript_6985:205-2010(+)